MEVVKYHDTGSRTENDIARHQNRDVTAERDYRSSGNIMA